MEKLRSLPLCILAFCAYFSSSAYSCGAADVSYALVGPGFLPTETQTTVEIYAVEGIIALGKVKSILTADTAAQGLIRYVGDLVKDKVAMKFELIPKTDNLPDPYRVFEAWAPLPLKILLIPNVAQ